MSEADSKGVTPAFSTAGALGLAGEVFKARPVSFVRLILIQALAFATLGTAQIWLMGVLGGVISEATAADPVAAIRASAWISLVSLLASVVSLAVWAWLEALWVHLFLKDRKPVQLTFGAVMRVLVAVFIVYLILMAASFAVSVVSVVLIIPVIIAVSMGGDPDVVMITVLSTLLFLIPFGLVLLLVMSRFSALPALAFMSGGIPLGQAWRGAKGRMGSLAAAWLVWGLLYTVVMIGFGAALYFGPSPFADVFNEVLSNPADPMAQYRAYADFSRSPGDVAGYWGMTFVGSLAFGALLAVARGIGVLLALEIDAREDGANAR
jgi:hypothetical protein